MYLQNLELLLSGPVQKKFANHCNRCLERTVILTILSLYKQWQTIYMLMFFGFHFPVFPFLTLPFGT